MSYAVRKLSMTACVSVVLMAGACKSKEDSSGVKVDPAPAITFGQFKANEGFKSQAYAAMSAYVEAQLNPTSNPDAAGKMGYLWRHMRQAATARGVEVTAEFLCAREVPRAESAPDLFVAKARFADSKVRPGQIVMNFLDYDLKAAPPNANQWSPGAGAKTEWWSSNQDALPLVMKVWNSPVLGPGHQLTFGSPDGATLALKATSTELRSERATTVYCTEAANLAKIGDPRLTRDVFEAGGQLPEITAANRR